MSKLKGKDAAEEQNFQIRPPFSSKFKPGAVKVRNVVNSSDYFTGFLSSVNKSSEMGRQVIASVAKS